MGWRLNVFRLQVLRKACLLTNVSKDARRLYPIHQWHNRTLDLNRQLQNHSHLYQCVLHLRFQLTRPKH